MNTNILYWCGGNVALTFTKDNAMHSENNKIQIGRWLIDNGIEENDILDNPQIRAIYKDKVYVSKFKPHRKPKSLVVHWFVNDQIFGCKFSNPKIGVMINEYGNLTTDPKMVSCGICRSIMTSAIKQNK